MFPFRSVAATALLACIGAPAFAQGQLNLICSAPVEWCNLAAAEFEKDTGIKVVIMHKLDRQALAELAEQSPNPRLDVWLGGSAGTHLRAVKFDLLAEYKSPMLAQLQPWAQEMAEQAKFKSIGLYLRVLGIGYNTELVTKTKAAAPACWKDLVKPGFAGEVQIEDPKSSPTAYTATVTLVQIFGEDQAFKYLKSMRKLASKGPQAGADGAKAPKKRLPAMGAGPTAPGSSPTAPGAGRTTRGGGRAAPDGTAVRSATTTIARIAFINDFVTEADAGAPLKVVTPCEGTVGDVGGLAIVKGARNLDDAKKFVEWALSAKAQVLGVSTKQFQYPANTSVQSSPLVPKFADIKFINYDSAKYDKSAERTRLLKRWQQEFGPAK